MKAGPQQDQAPSPGAIFVAILPQGSGSSLTLKVFEALARLIGIPIAQPIPVREVSPSETSPLGRGRFLPLVMRLGAAEMSPLLQPGWVKGRR